MIRKKTQLSEEEQAEFRQAMKDTKPLSQDKSAHEKPKPAITYSINSREPAYPQPIRSAYPILEYLEEAHWVSSDATLYYANPSLSRKLLQKLRRGQIMLQARIDLHRMTAEQALEAVNNFIDQCTNAQYRNICIIHGKGKYSHNDKPILKNLMNQFLRQHSKVLAFHSAQAKDGGTGALYVILKARIQSS